MRCGSHMTELQKCCQTHTAIVTIHKNAKTILSMVCFPQSMRQSAKQKKRLRDFKFQDIKLISQNKSLLLWHLIHPLGDDVRSQPLQGRDEVKNIYEQEDLKSRTRKFSLMVMDM